MRKTENDQVIRVALYIRVSSEEQVLHGLSLQAQEDALLRYAQENNMKVVGIYRDEGFSARKPLFKRKVMLDLLADVEARKFDRILFIKLDRWFRTLKEYYKCEDILEANRVTWQAILEDYNTATADGRLKVNIMLSVAEAEADKTSERIKFVFDAKLLRKEVYFPDQSAPYGYRVRKIDGVDRLVKDEETEEIVRFFFRNVIDFSIRKAGLDTNRKYGVARNYTQWYNMVRNEVYTGTLRGVANFCEPYLTPEEYKLISDRSRQARKAQQNRVYLFTGLVRCPDCGNRMNGRYTTSRTGLEYNYYRCIRAIVGKCTKHSLSERKIEAYLLANVRKELESRVLAYDVKQAHPKKAKQRNDVEKLQEKLRRLNVSFHAGNMSDDDYLAQAQEIKTQITRSQATEIAEEKLDIKSIKEFLSVDFEQIYTTLTKEEKRRLWRSVIDEIHTDGNEVTFVKYRA